MPGIKESVNPRTNDKSISSSRTTGEATITFDEYGNMIQGSREKQRQEQELYRQELTSRPPEPDWKAIEEVLKPSSIPDRTPQQILADKRMCPLCQMFMHHNLSVLREHIYSHPEIRAIDIYNYKQRERYLFLLSQRKKLKRQLEGIMKDLQDMDLKITNFENRADNKQQISEVRDEIVSALLEGKVVIDAQNGITIQDIDLGTSAVSDKEKTILADRMKSLPENSPERRQLQEMTIDEILHAISEEKRAERFF